MAAILSQPQCVNIMQLHLIQMQKGSILILGIPGECHTEITNRAPFQYLMKHLVLKSHQVTKPWDWGFKSSHHLEIWQAHRQQCCWGASQISEQLDNSKYESCAFKTLQDLTMKHIIGYWNGVQVAVHVMTRVLADCHWWFNGMVIPPPNEVGGGVYWIHLVRLSVRLSVDDMVSGA